MASSVSKSLPAVVISTVPESGAVQLHQTDLRALSPECEGSPDSAVACRFEPLVVTRIPSKTIRSAKSSFGGLLACAVASSDISAKRAAMRLRIQIRILRHFICQHLGGCKKATEAQRKCNAKVGLPRIARIAAIWIPPAHAIPSRECIRPEWRWRWIDFGTPWGDFPPI